MKAVSGTQMRSLDRRTITETGTSSEILMQRAGTYAAAGILKWLKETGLAQTEPEIVILAGKGNNGGDAFVAAKIIAEAGYEVSLHCTAPESDFSADSLTMFSKLPGTILMNYYDSLDEIHLSATDLVIVDGLLGTGFHGRLREPYRTWCRLVNASGKPVAALDIPSGLDADSGEADPDAIVADITFTMAAPKTGMFSEAGIRHTGRIEVVDICIPETFVNELPDTVECTDFADVDGKLKREAFDAHKYTRGHLFIAGGCKLYPGAPLLAAEAGLRSGAGLVTCCLPEHAEIHANIPKALIVRRLSSETGFFTAQSASELLAISGKAGAFAVGPGMGTATECVGFLEKMLAVPAPLLLDADALNLLATDPGLIEKLRGRKNTTVMTPHPGEMKRLAAALELNSETMSRPELAAAVAERLNAYIVYKGPRTVVAAPDDRYAVNLSGCPALATAGTGDILSGMIGAFLLDTARDSFEAIRMAVFLHGYTAEITAPLGSRGYIADDFLPMIGKAIRRI